MKISPYNPKKVKSMKNVAHLKKYGRQVQGRKGYICQTRVMISDDLVI